MAKTAKEELKVIFENGKILEHIDPKTNRAILAIYEALYRLAEKIDGEIDEKKMWESLINNGSDIEILVGWDIKKALRDQGLTVNDNGEIVSIIQVCE